MLLTLSAHSFKADLAGAKAKLRLGDLPKMAHDELGLHGLNVQTTYLAGWDLKAIESLRDRADKASCPCLLVIEEEPQRLGDVDDAAAAAAEERMSRVLQVASRLGCSSVAMGVKDPGPSAIPEDLNDALKRIVTKAERLELNLLIAPTKGITDTPEKLTSVIRKVGGFRIGAFPDFETAAASPDSVAYLRALTPYAAVVSASCRDFDAAGKHRGFDFHKCVDAVSSVGFDQTVSLEYRGTGDAQAALVKAKAAVEALAQEEPPEDDTE